MQRWFTQLQFKSMMDFISGENGGEFGWNPQKTYPIGGEWSSSTHQIVYFRRVTFSGIL